MFRERVVITAVGGSDDIDSRVVDSRVVGRIGIFLSLFLLATLSLLLFSPVKLVHLVSTVLLLVELSMKLVHSLLVLLLEELMMKLVHLLLMVLLSEELMMKLVDIVVDDVVVRGVDDEVGTFVY